MYFLFPSSTTVNLALRDITRSHSAEFYIDISCVRYTISEFSCYKSALEMEMPEINISFSRISRRNQQKCRLVTLAPSKCWGQARAVGRQLVPFDE